FDRVPPLDFFSRQAGILVYHDLGAERGIYPGTTPRYRARFAGCDDSRHADAWSHWVESMDTVLDLNSATATTDRSFLAVQVQVDRGAGWSSPTTAYLAVASGRVVAVSR
ncbi:MAG: hypothetical protein ABIF77_03125, partial [bacterium]